MTIGGAVSAVVDLGEVDTGGLVPDPVPYAALVPEAAGPLPFAWLLHGGGGDRGLLERVRPSIEEAWARGLFPPAVVVTPTVGARCFYMNYRDGSERWEDALVGPVLEGLRARYGTATTRDRTVVLGVSMGGMGALRMAFKHPGVFGAVAALEPGIEPALSFSDIAPEDRFWRDDDLFRRAFGDPVDEGYWRANNPANIVAADPGRLRVSGLAIYLECGDLDSFGLHRGTELLHRILYDHGVPHEYRLVRGADHVGATLAARFVDALGFLGRYLEPPGPDPELEPFHRLVDTLRTRAGLPPLHPGRGGRPG